MGLLQYPSGVTWDTLNIKPWNAMAPSYGSTSECSVLDTGQKEDTYIPKKGKSSFDPCKKMERSIGLWWQINPSLISSCGTWSVPWFWVCLTSKKLQHGVSLQSVQAILSVRDDAGAPSGSAVFHGCWCCSWPAGPVSPGPTAPGVGKGGDTEHHPAGSWARSSPGLGEATSSTRMLIVGVDSHHRNRTRALDLQSLVPAAHLFPACRCMY